MGQSLSRDLSHIPTLFTGLMLCAIPAAAQLSPGKLSRFHASLEGSTTCGKCHDRRRGVASEKCLACHGALAARKAFMPAEPAPMMATSTLRVSMVLLPAYRCW